MSQTYQLVRNALYSAVNTIDISAAKPDDWPDEEFGWGDRVKRPPKSNELNIYPAFVVMPFNDTQDTGDTETDLDGVTFSVYLIVKFAEADIAEDVVVDIADIVRTRFRELRDQPSDLLSTAYDLDFTGDWGGTPDQGERYYRLNVTVHVEEPLETP